MRITLYAIAVAALAAVATGFSPIAVHADFSLLGPDYQQLSTNQQFFATSSLKLDVGSLLGVSPVFVSIEGLSLVQPNTLQVEFIVSGSSGVDTPTLLQRLGGANTNNGDAWLNHTRALTPILATARVLSAPAVRSSASGIPTAQLYTLVGQVPLGGVDFATFNVASQRALRTALAADVGGLLRVNAASVNITDAVLEIPTTRVMVADFTVAVTSGTSAAFLINNLWNATISASWLTASQGVAAAVPTSGTLFVSAQPIVAYPTGVTPPPASISAATPSFTLVAIIAACVAVLAAA